MSKFTHLSANQAVPVNTQILSNAISDSHKKMRQNKLQYGSVFNGNILQDKATGREFRIKLVTEYGEIKSLGIKIPRRTDVQLLDREGQVIDSFAFNRGKNLAGNIEEALKKFPASASSSPDASYQDRVLTQGNLNRAAEGSEQYRIDHKNPDNKPKILQSTHAKSQNDLLAAKGNLKPLQPKPQAPTTPNLKPSADTAHEAEIQADKPGGPDGKTEIPADKTAHNVSGTAETTAADGIKSMEERVNEQLEKKIDNQQLFETLNRFSNKDGASKGNGIAQRVATNNFFRTVSRQEFARKDAWNETEDSPPTPILDLIDHEGKLSSKLNIFKNAADFLSPQQQISGNGGGLCRAEGNRMFSAKNNDEVKLFINLLCDPGLPMSVDERKQGLQAAMDTCTALWNDLQSDTPKLQTSITENGVELTKEHRQKKLKEWVTILQTAKDELDQKASAMNLGCGAAMASVIQFTDDDWELELLGRAVEDLRNSFQNQKETPEPIELNFNGQKFTIFASKAKRFKKAGTKITIKGPGNQEASFIFDQGRDLNEKLKISLKSVALQTYIERQPNAQTELKCCYVRQNLEKWSNHDGNSGIFQQMQAEALKAADYDDWNSPSHEEYKIIGRLQHPTSVLRNTLELLGSGQTIGNEGQRILERPDQMIKQTLSALQAAKNKGIINEEQSNALLNDLKSAVNTIAEACPDNEALQKFASDFAQLTLTEE